jgi:ribosomal protein S18 acetylase RimI-like enzyme
MPEVGSQVRVRPLDELDIGAITRIDERITGIYRPDVWESRVGYYLRRDPDSSQVAEVDGRLVGFMLGDVRAGEFGIEQPSGWIERFGIDPDFRGRDLGRQMFETIVKHFRSRGATAVRTMVDQRDQGVAGYLSAMGFRPSALQALEMPIADGTERQ